MPHIIVKMKQGRTEEQKSGLTNQIVNAVTKSLGVGPETVSIELIDVNPNEWKSSVFESDIAPKLGGLAKEPGTLK